MILLSAPGMSDAVVLYVYKAFDLEKCVKQHKNNIKKKKSQTHPAATRHYTCLEFSGWYIPVVS